MYLNTIFCSFYLIQFEVKAYSNLLQHEHDQGFFAEYGVF